MSYLEINCPGKYQAAFYLGFVYYFYGFGLIFIPLIHLELIFLCGMN